MRRLQHHRQLDHRVDADPSSATWKRLDDVALTEVRKLWWRLCRHGARLPAERGVIVIDGGRP